MNQRVKLQIYFHDFLSFSYEERCTIVDLPMIVMEILLPCL